MRQTVEPRGSCEMGCFPQTGGKQRAHDTIGIIRFTSPSEITNPDNVLFQANRVQVYSGMTLLSEKLVIASVVINMNYPLIFLGKLVVQIPLRLLLTV